MTKSLLHIIGLIAAFLPTVVTAQINTEKVMMIGKNALYFEDYVLSIQYFNQVIDAKSYLADPYFFRGVAKLNLEDFSGAENDCTKALERNPYIVNAYQARGMARIRLKNFKGAIEDYRKAIKLSPENIGSWHNLVVCRMQDKDYQQAYIDIDTLIRIAPRYTEAYLMRAEVSMKSKDTLQAVVDAGRAIDIERYNPVTWATRAMIALGQKKYAQGESDLTEAIRLSFRDAGLYINRALARYYQNNLRGAMSDYDIALDIDRNNFVGHYNRGLLRAQVGDDNRAIEDFDFVIEAEPDNTMAIFNRGLLRDKTGDLKGAVSDYTRVLTEYPSFMLGYQYRANALRKLGNRRGAEADEFKILKSNLDAQNAMANGGKKKDSQDDEKTRNKSDKNVNNFRKIIVADEDESTVGYKADYRGRVQDKNVNIEPQPMFVLSYYERLSDVRMGIAFDKGIDHLNSMKVLPYRLLITNNEKSLDEKQVKEHFASINRYSSEIELHPDNFYHYYARALDFYLVQDFDNAIADLDSVIAKAPDFYPAYFSRAVICNKQMEYSRRDRKYEFDKLDSAPKNAAGNYEYRRIRDDLDKVIEKAPDFIYAYYNRGNIALSMKDFRGAIMHYDKALALEPKFAEAYFNRGLTYIYLGENRRGLEDLSKAGELGLFYAYNILKRFAVSNEK